MTLSFTVQSIYVTLALIRICQTGFDGSGQLERVLGWGYNLI